jgi:hypothetical protein
MNASRPEADTEYSRGVAANRGPGNPPARPRRGGAHPAGLTALLAAVAVGGALLIAAEFLPLLHVRSGAYHGGVIKTVQTGQHNSYALIPLALVALALAFSAWLGAGRLATASIGLLGLVALGIALLGDLPDTRASGLVRGASGAYVLAASSPAAGFYFETAGAVVLLLCAGAGLLLVPRR